MATTARRRLDREERRRQLVELGIEMLSREPRELVAMDRIAEQAGISRGLLFHYFPSKRDYHLAVIEAAAARLLDLTEPDLALGPDDRLRASLDRFLEFVESNEALYRALIRGAAGADPELQQVFERTRAAIAGRVVAFLGLDRPTPALRNALHGWIAFIEETTLDWLRHRDLDRSALVRMQGEALAAAIELAGMPLPELR